MLDPAADNTDIYAGGVSFAAPSCPATIEPIADGGRVTWSGLFPRRSSAWDRKTTNLYR